MADEAITARITGRVQGVSFRAWTRDKALALGLTGWVRNEPDGAVSGYFAGSPDAIAELIRDLHNGPAFARVDSVETAPARSADAPGAFRITF